MASASHRVSLSKSALLLSPCVAWAADGVPWYDEDKVDGADLSKRDKGTLFHQMIAAGVNQTKHISCPDDVWNWYLYAKTYVEELLLPRCESYQTEVPIAVNWSTGDVQILTIKDREYPDIPGYQFGTTDLVCILKDGSLLIGDWKTGGTDGAEDQLLSLACAFQKVMVAGAVFGAGSLNYVMERKRPVKIACLQVNDDGVWPHERDVTQQELDNHWDSMRFQWEDVCAGKRTNQVLGIHCTTLYCPHLGHCDAVGGVVSSLASEAGPSTQAPLVPVEALMRKVTDKPLTDTDAGDKMALISAANRQIKYATEQMKAHVKGGGRVINGQYEWSEGDNGFRWRKGHK